jgi:hypothetical protein
MLGDALPGAAFVLLLPWATFMASLRDSVAGRNLGLCRRNPVSFCVREIFGVGIRSVQ